MSLSHKRKFATFSSSSSSAAAQPQTLAEEKLASVTHLISPPATVMEVDSQASTQPIEDIKTPNQDDTITVHDFAALNGRGRMLTLRLRDKESDPETIQATTIVCRTNWIVTADLQFNVQLFQEKPEFESVASHFLTQLFYQYAPSNYPTFPHGLMELNLSHCRLRENYISLLSTGLAKNGTLTALDLEGAFSATNAVYACTSFGKMLLTNKSLLRLNLGDNRIDEKGADQIAKGLAANTTLTSLDFSQNSLQGMCVVLQSQHLESFKSQKNILGLKVGLPFDLCKAHNFMQAEALKFTSQLSADKTNLTELDISCEVEKAPPNNVFTFTKILQALTRNTTVSSVSLDALCYRSCETSARQALAGLLRNNRTITHLNVTLPCYRAGSRCQSAKHDDAEVIASLVGEEKSNNNSSSRPSHYKGNTSLLFFSYSFNNGEKEQKDVNKVMERNRRLAAAWAKVSIIIAFIRANSGNGLVTSILSLLPEIMRLLPHQPIAVPTSPTLRKLNSK